MTTIPKNTVRSSTGMRLCLLKLHQCIHSDIQKVYESALTPRHPQQPAFPLRSICSQEKLKGEEIGFVGRAGASQIRLLLYIGVANQNYFGLFLEPGKIRPWPSLTWSTPGRNNSDDTTQAASSVFHLLALYAMLVCSACLNLGLGYFLDTLPSTSSHNSVYAGRQDLLGQERVRRQGLERYGHNPPRCPVMTANVRGTWVIPQLCESPPMHGRITFLGMVLQKNL